MAFSQQASYTDRSVGEVSANFCGYMVLHGQRSGSPRPLSSVTKPEQLFFHSSSLSVFLTRLSGPRSRLITSQKIWARREQPRDVWICSQEL
jgi:hypothetical protein